MRKFAVTFTVALALAPVVAVAANSPSQTVYGGQSVSVKSAVAKSPGKPPAAEQGQLPFTGVDLGIALLAGGALVGVGFGLRRLDARRRD